METNTNTNAKAKPKLRDFEGFGKKNDLVEKQNEGGGSIIYFLLSINENEQFESLFKRISTTLNENGISSRSSIFPSNITEENELKRVLAEVTRDEEIDKFCLIYDTSFAKSVENDFKARSVSNFHFHEWDGVFSKLSAFIETVFQQNNKPDDEPETITIDSIIEKLNDVKIKNFRPKIEVEPSKPIQTHIIQIVGNGGVGKTLISSNLANKHALMGKKVFLVGDLFTHLYLAETRSNFDVFQFNTDFDLAKFVGKYDYIIFDGIDTVDELFDESIVEDDIPPLPPITTKYCVVKNLVEFSVFSKIFAPESLIFSDSYGHEIFPDAMPDAQILKFSTKIYAKNSENTQKNSIILDPTIFEHLTLFSRE